MALSIPLSARLTSFPLSFDGVLRGLWLFVFYLVLRSHVWMWAEGCLSALARALLGDKNYAGAGEGRRNFKDKADG